MKGKAALERCAYDEEQDARMSAMLPSINHDRYTSTERERQVAHYAGRLEAKIRLLERQLEIAREGDYQPACQSCGGWG